MQDTLLEPLCFNHNVFGCLQTCSYPLNTMAQIDMEERKNIPPRVEYRSKWGHPEYMYILNALKGRWCSLVVTRCFDFATVTRCLQALFCQFDLTLEKKNSNEQKMPEVLSCQLCLLIVVFCIPTCTVIDRCNFGANTLAKMSLFATN